METMELPLELRERYLIRREKDVVDCDVALVEKNSAVLERVGHQLKGNAATYGYPELGAIGADMENAAKNNNWAEMELQTEKFKQFILSLPKLPNR